MSMKIGDKVKKIREIKNISQEQLAEKLNITPQAYSKLERSKTKMDEERLEQIAEHLGVSADLIRSFEPNNLFINTAQNVGNSSKMIIKNNENQQIIDIIINSKDEIINQQKERIERLQADNEFLKAQLKQITELLNK